ncbi:hypothetical protein ABEQ16_03715 [Cutibacterium acnes]
MFRKRLTRVELGRALGVTPAAAGRKLRGEIGWSIGDLFHVAEFRVKGQKVCPESRIFTD